MFRPITPPCICILVPLGSRPCINVNTLSVAAAIQKAHYSISNRDTAGHIFPDAVDKTGALQTKREWPFLIRVFSFALN